MSKPEPDIMGSKAWPKDVPVLTADDFMRGWGADGKDGPHCMLGWINVVFGGNTSSGLNSVTNDDICKEVRKVAVKVAKTHKKSLGLKNVSVLDNDYDVGNSIPSVNDNQGNSKEQLAKWWNTTMRKLGYVDVS